MTFSIVSGPGHPVLHYWLSYNNLLLAVESSNEVYCIFVDFSKVFDKVDHHLLLHKLHQLRIDHDVVLWVGQYLSGRTQHVVLNGVRSDATDVTSGVLQGSILRPLLFLVYVNDITRDIESTDELFAYDGIIYRVTKNDNYSNGLQSDLTIVEEWCMEYGIEYKKCVNMLGFLEKPQSW